MKRWAIFFSFSIPILLAACNQRQPTPSIDCSRFQIGKAIPVIDTLTADISYHDYLYFLASQLNIPNIIAREKDSTLRIWFWQDDTVFLLSLEKHGTLRSGNLISFARSRHRPKITLTVTHCSATAAPIHGWNRLFDTLKADNILSIPDGKPNDQLYYDMTGGGRIYVDLQLGNKYRFYSYLEPGYFQYADSNAAKLHHFLTYVQKELSLRVYIDMTRFAETPIRPGTSITQVEYRFLRDNKFIDSGENVLQIYGDFKSYTAILTDKRIGDYFPREINLGDSVYEFALIPTVRQVNLNFSSRGPDTFRVSCWNGSAFTLRLGGDRQQLMNFFDSANLLLRRTRKFRGR